MNHEKKTPLIRLAKRDGMEGWKVWCIRAGSILFALLLGALVMGLAGANPVTAYGTMISGALGKKSAIRQTVKIAVPLLGCALAIAPCFKMRFWNIGAEGQITAGAIAASYFALFWANRLPSPEVKDLIDTGDLPVLAYIPSDASLAEFDLKGENVFYLPSDAAIVQGVRQALREIGLIEA